MEDPRIWTLTAGVGNPMGWYGLQAEGYFARGRFSGFAGAGYAPVADVAFAAGLRGYTSGSTHRGFAELSVSLLYISTVGNALGEFENVEYGPGIQVGYQYVRRNGLTLAVSIGIGSSGAEGASPMMGLGIGKTWRRR